MNNPYVSSSYKEVKQKEKVDLLILIIIFLLSYFSFSNLSSALGSKEEIAKITESIGNYKLAVFETTESEESISSQSEKVSSIAQAVDTNLLHAKNIDNALHIEFYINDVLKKYNQQQIDLGETYGQNSLDFVNSGKNILNIPVNGSNPEDIIKIMEEFHSGGYLSGIGIEKDGNLYTGYIQLTFQIQG